MRIVLSPAALWLQIVGIFFTRILSSALSPGRAALRLGYFRRPALRSCSRGSRTQAHSPVDFFSCRRYLLRRLSLVEEDLAADPFSLSLPRAFDSSSRGTSLSQCLLPLLLPHGAPAPSPALLQLAHGGARCSPAFFPAIFSLSARALLLPGRRAMPAGARSAAVSLLPQGPSRPPCSGRRGICCAPI